MQPFQGFGFGDGGFHMSFGIGAFPFGFFASTFNLGDGRVGHPRKYKMDGGQSWLTQEIQLNLSINATQGEHRGRGHCSQLAFLDRFYNTHFLSLFLSHSLSLSFLSHSLSFSLSLSLSLFLSLSFSFSLPLISLSLWSQKA